MTNLVFVRLRPLKAQEKQACLRGAATNSSIVCKSSDGKGEEFEFDQVFPSDATQEDIFKGVEHIVHAVLEEGYNGTIMAYGQTSAGKTHSMFNIGCSSEQRGIVPRVAKLASSIAASSSSSECTIKLSASVVEIYNERCRDLLDPTHDNLQVFQDAQGVSVPGMKSVPVRNEDDCVKIVHKGMNSRAVGSTNMNAESSRSHCLVILTVNKAWKDGRKQRSKLFLVDLAGSERQSKTGAQGITLQEGQNINKSLLVLGSVVNALNDTGPKSRVPYRDSKLTRLLQDSLGGTAKTCILVCCSPAMNNHTETLSSLRFGARARAIQSTAQVNAIAVAPPSLAAAQEEISVLKRDLEEARLTAGSLLVAPPAQLAGDKPKALRPAVWVATTVAQAAGVLFILGVDYLCSGCKMCEVN